MHTRIQTEREGERERQSERARKVEEVMNHIAVCVSDDTKQIRESQMDVEYSSLRVIT